MKRKQPEPECRYRQISDICYSHWLRINMQTNLIQFWKVSSSIALKYFSQFTKS